MAQVPQTVNMVYVSEQTVVVSPSTPITMSGYSENYQSDRGLATGVIQLICAAVSIIIGGVAYIGFDTNDDEGIAIWIGLVVFLPAGILGIVSKGKNTCVIIAYMIMSIIACLAAFAILVTELHVLKTDCINGTCDATSIVLYSLLAVVALVEVVTSLAGWIYCTAVVCGRNSHRRRENYQSDGGLATGVIQLICAMVSVIIGGVAYIGFNTDKDEGIGIWIGLAVFLPASILGIVSKGKSTSVIIAYMIMSIIACLAAFAMLVTELQFALNTDCNDFICDTRSIVLYSLLAVVALVEVVTSLAGWIYCTAVVCCQSRNNAQRFSGYNTTGGYGTGITQLICAIVIVIAGGVSYIAFKITYDGASGVWAGLILFLPAGILGIISRRRDPCVVVAYMIVSALAAVTSFCLLVVHIQFAAGEIGIQCAGIGCEGNPNVVVHSIIAIVALAEFIASLTGTIYCMGGVCCGGSAEKSNQATPQFGQGNVNMAVITEDRFGY